MLLELSKYKLPTTVLLNLRLLISYRETEAFKKPDSLQRNLKIECFQITRSRFIVILQTRGYTVANTNVKPVDV